MDVFQESTNVDQPAASISQNAPQMRVRRKGQAAQVINGNGRIPNGSSASGDGPNSDQLLAGADDLLSRLKNM